MKKGLIFLTLLSGFIAAFRLADNSYLVYPAYFPKPVYPFARNQPSEAKILLGRTLFFDNRLSKNQSISCASCHSNYNAFAHTDHALSHGIYDSIGTRNAPALINLAWQNTFMWDGAIKHLDMQSLAPLQNKIEMDEELGHVIDKLTKTSIYPALYYRAFGDSLPTGEYTLKALSAFMLSLVSVNSRYDSVRLGLTKYNTQESNGYALFQAHCNACHTEPLFTNFSFENNGLPIDPHLRDKGRMNVTHRPADSLKFKVPTLRNIAYTFPYMHDGRFKNINEVLNHYDHQVQRSPTLANALRNGIKLTSNERVDLISFLMTLSDKDFIFNAKHSFPKDILLTETRDVK